MSSLQGHDFHGRASLDLRSNRNHSDLGAIMKDCQFLLKAKGHGTPWCTVYGEHAKCSERCRNAAKVKVLAEMYGGVPADSSYGRRVTGRFIEEEVPVQGLCGRAISRLKRLLKKGRNTPKQNSYEAQERRILNEMRETYQALMVHKYCPECLRGPILTGPGAGGCQNVQCQKCKSTFWVSHGTKEGIWLDRGTVDGSASDINIDRV